MLLQCGDTEDEEVENHGYARDFVPLMERILPDLVTERFRVISNAGGVNPLACAEAVVGGARKLGLAGQVRVALVSGDDILPRIDELLAAGHEMRDMDTGRPLSDIRDRVVSANAYLGMAPVVEALGSFGSQAAIIQTANQLPFRLQALQWISIG